MPVQVGSSCHVYLGPTPQARIMLAEILHAGAGPGAESGIGARVQYAAHLVSKLSLVVQG